MMKLRDVTISFLRGSVVCVAMAVGAGCGDGSHALCLAPLAPLKPSACKSVLAPGHSPTGATPGTFPVGRGAYGVAFDGTNLWVVNQVGTVTELSPGGVTLGSFNAGTLPSEIAFDGTNMWVVDQDPEPKHRHQAVTEL